MSVQPRTFLARSSVTVGVPVVIAALPAPPPPVIVALPSLSDADVSEIIRLYYTSLSLNEKKRGGVPQEASATFVADIDNIVSQAGAQAATIAASQEAQKKAFNDAVDYAFTKQGGDLMRSIEKWSDTVARLFGGGTDVNDEGYRNDFRANVTALVSEGWPFYPAQALAYAQSHSAKSSAHVFGETLSLYRSLSPLRQAAVKEIWRNFLVNIKKPQIRQIALWDDDGDALTEMVGYKERTTNRLVNLSFAFRQGVCDAIVAAVASGDDIRKIQVLTIRRMFPTIDVALEIHPIEGTPYYVPTSHLPGSEAKSSSDWTPSVAMNVSAEFSRVALDAAKKDSVAIPAVVKAAAAGLGIWALLHFLA